ncbi:hypothetical protein QEG98_40480 [Myxococcus sp. MxC21-1]|uniref:hypothetical protein n=1 Tax=Myxococcus sp. MxC21-1 TaxID=3041439 RepID=UPI00292F5C2E|nr:hypothetical protein [Myxococcus sp. MxC21-1]WNZ62033.1 hypothetical protein QEG98_40480 [Myxococcus sp. MxC21-1]
MTANLDCEHVNARGFPGVLPPVPLSAGGRTTLAPSLPGTDARPLTGMLRFDDDWDAER